MRKVMFFEGLLVYIGPGKNIRGSLEKSELAKYIQRLGSAYALSFTVTQREMQGGCARSMMLRTLKSIVFQTF